MELDTVVRLLEGLVRCAWPEDELDEMILDEAEAYLEELKQIQEAINE